MKKKQRKKMNENTTGRKKEKEREKEIRTGKQFKSMKVRIKGCKETVWFKGRRDYRMAPKWTISRRRYRHFNITNGR